MQLFDKDLIMDEGKKLLGKFNSDAKLVWHGSIVYADGPHNDIDVFYISAGPAVIGWVWASALAEAINIPIDICLLSRKEYAEYVKTGLSCNAHQVFYPYRTWNRPGYFEGSGVIHG